MPNCLERHSLCTEANWGLPTQHFQKGIIVWVSIKNIINKKKKKKKKKISYDVFYRKNSFKMQHKRMSIFSSLVR